MPLLTEQKTAIRELLQSWEYELTRFRSTLPQADDYYDAYKARVRAAYNCVNAGVPENEISQVFSGYYNEFPEELL